MSGTGLARLGVSHVPIHAHLYHITSANQSLLTIMNDYDLLGLMDTYNAMKKQGLDVPNSFTEFLTGITPIDDGSNIETPQITQGTSSYGEAIGEVKQREQTADYVTNQLGVGQSTIGSDTLTNFIPGTRKPHPSHQEAFEHGKRLRTRQELGYDIK